MQEDSGADTVTGPPSKEGPTHSDDRVIRAAGRIADVERLTTRSAELQVRVSLNVCGRHFGRAGTPLGMQRICYVRADILRGTSNPVVVPGSAANLRCVSTARVASNMNDAQDRVHRRPLCVNGDRTVRRE